MTSKKLLFSVMAIAVVCLTLGFLALSGDDPTTSVSSSTFRSSEQTPTITGDFFLGSWSVGATVPTPGSYGGAGVGFSRNDTCWLYALNGDTNGGGGTAGHFRKFNITTNTWTALPPSIGRSWVSAAKLGPLSNTYIYAFGGFPTGASLPWTSMTGTLQRYSINTNTWTTMTDAPVPAGSSGLYGYQDSLLYAVGGMGTGSAPITNVQLYNQTSGTWRQATPLPVARANGWIVIRGDTIYYGCGAGPTTATFNNDIYVGKISSTDRSVITWTTSAVTYPGVSRHRMDAADFGSLGMFIGPGAAATWWGTGNDAYTWQGGSSAFVSVGPVPVVTSDAQVGTASFQRGNYRVWKAVVATGLILAVPYYIPNTQIYTDSVYSPSSIATFYSSQWCAGGTYPALPSVTYFQASAWLGDTLYTATPDGTGAGTSTIIRYSLGGSWTTGVSMPGTKTGGTLTACNGKLYYIGGGSTSILTPETVVYEYTPSTGSWATKAPLPVALSGHGAGNWGDSVIFVAGGPYTGPTGNVYFYRVGSNTWGTSTAMPSGGARRTFACGISGNKLFVAGGYSGTAFMKTFFLGTIGSDATTITWVQKADVPIPATWTGISRPGGVAFGDRFYVIGGERGGPGGYRDSVDVWNITLQTWQTIITGKPGGGMSNIFAGAAARKVNDTVKVFVPGGYNGAGSTNFDVIGCGPTLTGITGNIGLPKDFELSQNYPNPFNPVTKINYALPKSGLVTLKVYDILGREVMTLVNEMKSAGKYTVDFNGANLSSGIYFYSLKSGDFTSVKKMTLIK